MKNKKNQKIIVVIGSGRSGTSLLMQVLESLGMTTSEEMIPAKEHNPLGAYEDTEIFSIQEKLLNQTTPDSMRPPGEWLKADDIHDFRRELKAVVEKRCLNCPTVFGFKDPRTALFIPMWTQIFNDLNISPLYVLATRRPETVITSKMRQFNANEKVTELFWLTKNIESLYQTGGNCFIVHYEDWFTEKAPKVAEDLLKYTGLHGFWDHKVSMPEHLAHVIKPNLNRAVFNEYEVKNRYVHTLQAKLEHCRGDQFDRQGLMDVVMDCRKAMDEFSGWEMEAHRFFNQNRFANANQETIKKHQEIIKKHQETIEKNQETIEKFQADLKKVVFERNDCLEKCKDLSEDNENLRIKISVEKTKKNSEVKISPQIKRLEKKVFSLQTSTSFQLGQILINAVAKPGKNTILFPFYILRMMLASRIAK